MPHDGHFCGLLTHLYYTGGPPRRLPKVVTIASAPKAPVLIPFVCPICAGGNAVELLILSRAGGMSCQQCGKHLRSADVMRAMHAPRSPPTSNERRVPVREMPAKKPEMVWPPTPESRAAIAPLRRRTTHGERN